MLGTLSRGSLVLLHRPEGGAGNLRDAFLHGLRFDAASVAYPLAVALLLATVWRAVRRSNADRIAATLALVPSAVVAVIEPLYFGEFRTRPDFVLLEYLDDPATVLSMVADTVGLVGVAVHVLVLAVLVGGCWWLLGRGRGESIDARPSWAGRGAVLVLLFLVARGGFGRPLRPQDADRSPDRFTNQMTLSGLFSLERTLYEWAGEGDGPRLGPNGPGEVALVRTMVGRGGSPTWRWPLDGPDPVARTHVVPAGIPPARNVVMVVMESVAARYTGALGDGARPSLTPRLDALAGRGILYTRFLASGPSTNRSLPALLAGFPCLLKRTALTKSVEGRRPFRSLARVLEPAGFRSLFATGGASSWENLGGWCRAQGFDEVIDRDAFDDDASTSVWGPPDHVLLDRVLAECDRLAAGGDRFLAVALTSTNHPPFAVPDVVPPDLVLPEVPDRDDVEPDRARALLYADAALGRFVDAARARPWGADTGFVLVGDHGVHLDASADIDPDRRHVPLLLLGGALAPGRDPRIASQVDLLPTVLTLVGAAVPHAAWGRDLLGEDPAPRYAVMGPHGGHPRFAVADGEGHFLICSPEGPVLLHRLDYGTHALTPVRDVPTAARLYLLGRAYLVAARATLASRVSAE